MRLSSARSRFLVVLALSTGLAGPAAWAQTSSYDTGSDPVTVDLSVLNGSGSGSGAMPSGPSAYQENSGGLRMPGPRAPRSRLYVEVPGGGSPSMPTSRLTQPAPAPKPAPRREVASAPAPKMAKPAAPAPQAKKEPARLEPQAAPKQEAKPAKPAAPAKEMAAKEAPPPAPKVAEADTSAPPPPPETSAPPPAPEAAAAPEPAAKPAETKTETASVDTSAGTAAPKSLRVEFPAEDTRLPNSMTANLEALAKELAGKESLRVQLLAYAGGKDLSPSKARRLSLSRALSVRSFLIDKGVRSTRIDVRALGDKTDEQPKNRVDVEVVER